MTQLAFTDLETPADRRLRLAFERFDEANPSVWEHFERLTWEAIDAGHRKFSARVIIGVIRWRVAIHTTGKPFKINDHHARFYGARFMARNPQHAGFFETRGRRHGN